MLPASAQTVPAGKSRLFLWEGRYAPVVNPRPSGIADTATYGKTDSVRNPWLLEYRPSTPNGTAVIVIPGGGYDNLSPWGSEGVPAANHLSARGVTVFILRYRVRPYGYPHAMWDVQRAVRWVRAHATAYGLDPRRIGVLGYSAGGHVASTAATHFDAGLADSGALAAAGDGPHWYPGPKDSIDLVSSRPDFHALVYPMTTMVRYVPGTTTAYAYGPGRTIYIGNNPTQTLEDYTSNEKRVTAQTPPAFINWGTADNLVNQLNSTAYRDSLLSKGVHVKTVVVQGGGHDDTTPKLDSLYAWMDVSGLLTTTIRSAPRTLRSPFARTVRPQGAPDALGRTRTPTGPRLNISTPSRETP